MKRTLAVTLAFLATLSAPVGCGPSDPAPVSVIVALDVSCPSEQLTNRYGATLYALQRPLGSRSKLTVVAFANSCRVVYEGPALGSRSSFNDRLGSALLASAKSKERPGTKTDMALGEMSRLANGSKTPVVAVVLTDGGIEDVSPLALRSIRASIDRLSRNPQLKCLVIAGVLPEHRAKWSRWLAPLGDKGIVRGSNDAKEVLASCTETTILGGSR